MNASYTDYLNWLAQQERMIPQPQMPQPQNMMQPALSYVANRTAADLYNVGAGQAAILIDMDAPFVYRKSRGADGKLLPLEIYDLVPHTEEVQSLEGYVRYEDIDKIVSEKVEKKITEAFKPAKKKAED